VNGEIKREWFDKDYYQTLGVPKNASAADVRKAYRKLAQEHHPDRNRGNKEAEERFKEVSSAYDVLGDAEKRKQYDQVRDMAAAGFGGARPGGQGWPGGSGGVRVEGFPFGGEGGFDVGDLGDLFGGLFGGRRGDGGEARPARGSDLQTEARITFEEAMEGVTVPLRIEGPAACPRCAGSGAEPGTAPQVCPQCGGSGATAQNQGVFSFSRTCSRCGGSGRVVENPCRECRGSGSVRRTREFSVRIPAGVRDGARIRVSGRGESGPAGSRSGDLYVVVRVSPHRLFGRKGSDLTLEVPVTFAEAALGAHIRLPTLNGDVTLKVPAGTASGRTFRVRGKGAPKSKGGTGDLLVTVRVEVPGKLSREQKDLLKKLQQAEGESPRARLGMEA
jgi:molecular chaperone DnaJ